MKEIRKVVVAYSGGLDTSVILSWLKEKYGCEVVAFIADLGQEEDLGAIKAKALKTGARQAYIKDVKDVFVSDYLFPMLRADAVYEGAYLLGTSIARPLIAKTQMEVVKEVGADAVAHGATGKGNDQVRFELTYYTIDPKIHVIAPWREWEFKSRTHLIEYSRKHNIPVAATKDKPYSSDRNIFHITDEGGILEDPWAEPPSDMYTLMTPAESAPDRPVYVEVSYERGDPVAVDGKRMRPLELLQALNRIGGENGIGRVDLVENRYVGIKSRGVYETPGGTILHHAHRAMESITLDREVYHMKDSMVTRYAEMVYYGYWFSPERMALQKFIDETQGNVTGDVRLKLYKGNVSIVGRRSPYSLYNLSLATFEEEYVYDQKDAEGFIKVNALRLKRF
ncbi:MAG: argininosuccinate synthase [Deltaproteobacteria bacterium]|nr:argininosuccinate synthase [Deltaproteobacteria bacterium]